MSSFPNQLPHNKLLINVKRSVFTGRSQTLVLMILFAGFFLWPVIYAVKFGEYIKDCNRTDNIMVKTRLKTGENLEIEKKYFVTKITGFITWQGKSERSDWFFFGRDFTIGTVSRETVQAGKFICSFNY